MRPLLLDAPRLPLQNMDSGCQAEANGNAQLPRAKHSQEDPEQRVRLKDTGHLTVAITSLSGVFAYPTTQGPWNLS